MLLVRCNRPECRVRAVARRHHSQRPILAAQAERRVGKPCDIVKQGQRRQQASADPEVVPDGFRYRCRWPIPVFRDIELQFAHGFVQGRGRNRQPPLVSDLLQLRIDGARRQDQMPVPRQFRVQDLAQGSINAGRIDTAPESGVIPEGRDHGYSVWLMT